MKDSEARPPTDKELQHRSALIELLAGEVDRQLISVGERTRSMATRASILVGAASITTGLQLAEGPKPWTFLVSVAAAVLAAFGGIAVLIPRVAPEVPIEEGERSWWNSSAARARWTLTHWKLNNLKEQESALKWRARCIVAGFLMLTLALIFAALAATA